MRDDLIVGLHHVQVSCPAGSQDAVSDLDALALAVGGSGARVRWDDNLPGVRRFHTDDPVGIRLEFQQVRA